MITVEHGLLTFLDSDTMLTVENVQQIVERPVSDFHTRKWNPESVFEAYKSNLADGHFLLTLDLQDPKIGFIEWKYLRSGQKKYKKLVISEYQTGRLDYALVTDGMRNELGCILNEGLDSVSRTIRRFSQVQERQMNGEMSYDQWLVEFRCLKKLLVGSR